MSWPHDWTVAMQAEITELRSIAHQVEILTAERNALKMDANRYQWLRTQNAHLDSSLTIALEDQGDCVWVGSDLDAVVDDAMKAAK